MTELGSIYGTTVDGSNTLVIDFSNVDICGNLNINGGLAIDNSFGSVGQVLTSQGYDLLPKWKILQKSHGYATYMNEGNLVTDYSVYNGSTHVQNPSIYSVVAGLPYQVGTTYSDVAYTSLHGMVTTYTPVGTKISFRPSTQAINTGSTVNFVRNPIVDSINLTPCRWRIEAQGHYRIHAAVKIQDSQPVYNCCLIMWQRTGGSSSLSGTNVNVIGLTESKAEFGNNQYHQQQMGTVLSVEGIYELNQYDEIYFSVNADTNNGGYGASILTYTSIQEM